jgi:hypothetical protein
MGLPKMIPGVLLKAHDPKIITSRSPVRREFGKIELY